jgi:HJR/Mrr/RecB family endonuclease
MLNDLPTTRRIKREAASQAFGTCFGSLIFIWMFAFVSIWLLLILLVIIFVFSFNNRLSKMTNFVTKIEKVDALVREDKVILAQNIFRDLHSPASIFKSHYNRLYETIESAMSEYEAKMKIIKEESARKQREETFREIQIKETLDGLSPQEFELIVLEAFSKLGYQATHTSWTADGGIDGILTQGKTKIAIQCKKYQGKITEPALRDFYGAMKHSNFTQGIYVTTSNYTKPARDFAKGKNIRLMDGRDTLKMLRSTIMSDFVLKGRTVTLPPRPVKRFCPQCGSELKMKQGPYGLFWGCANYPRCQFTKN